MFQSDLSTLCGLAIITSIRPDSYPTLQQSLLSFASLICTPPPTFDFGLSFSFWFLPSFICFFRLSKTWSRSINRYAWICNRPWRLPDELEHNSSVSFYSQCFSLSLSPTTPLRLRWYIEFEQVNFAFKLRYLFGSSFAIQQVKGNWIIEIKKKPHCSNSQSTTLIHNTFGAFDSIISVRKVQEQISIGAALQNSKIHNTTVLSIF